MYRKILVGYAADRHGEDALALARLLASAESVEEVLIAEAREPSASEEAESPVPSGWPAHVRVSHRVASGDSPADALSSMADDEGADVIVLGATHRHMLGRVLFGTTADSLLPGARWPIVVAPAGYSKASSPLHQLAVGVDGTEESSVAIDWAVAMASAYSAKIRLLGVIEPPPPVENWGPDAPAEMWHAGFTPQTIDALTDVARERMRPHLQAVTASLGEGRGEIVTVVGDVVQELRQAAEDADMLVVGSHGGGRVSGALLGSVSRALTHSCPRPLAVVAPAA